MKGMRLEYQNDMSDKVCIVIMVPGWMAEPAKIMMLRGANNHGSKIRKVRTNGQVLDEGGQAKNKAIFPNYRSDREKLVHEYQTQLFWCFRVCITNDWACQGSKKKDQRVRKYEFCHYAT